MESPRLSLLVERLAKGTAVKRRLWATLHRYSGLTIAVIIAVAALTGSILAFTDEIDRSLNPTFFRATSAGPALPMGELVRRAEAQLGDRKVWYVKSNRGEKETVALWADRSGTATLEVFVDPGNGSIVGMREQSRFAFDRPHFIQSVFALHDSFAIPGRIGVWLFAIAALAWMANSFIGVYLSVPKPATWTRFKRFLLPRVGGNRERVNYDLHRAIGLWMLPVATLLGFTGFALNTHGVVDRAVGLFAPVRPDIYDRYEARGGALHEAAINWTAAQKLGRATMLKHADQIDFEGPIVLQRKNGVYIYSAHTEHDIGRDTAKTFVVIDAKGLKVIDVEKPRTHGGGNTFMSWLYPLHTGEAFGVVGRIVIAICGIVVTIIVLTGSLAWWWRASGNRAKQRRRAESSSALQS
jgi:uncharacterized iron-regulated membrane protein